MTEQDDKLCNLLDEAIDLVNFLLAKDVSKEKIMELLNKIEEPVLRRCVLVYTGLWN